MDKDLIYQTNDLCTELKKTYDSRVILKYPKEIQQIFFSVSKKKRKKHVGNKILISLINNLKFPTIQPVVDYLTGPDDIIKMTSSPNKYNKVIYLFGEKSHSSLTGCKVHINSTKVQDYLLKLFCL